MKENDRHKETASLPAQPARNTPVRNALSAIFDAASGPLSCAQILESLNANGLTANKTTVYRQLDALVSQDIIVELDLGEGLKRYELAKKKVHPHLFCLRCGKVECLPFDDALADTQKALAGARGFQVMKYSLELFGVCESCTEVSCVEASRTEESCTEVSRTEER